MKASLEQNEKTGQYRIIGIYGTTPFFTAEDHAYLAYGKLKKNWRARRHNQFLRDLTGKSARTARIMMKQFDRGASL